MYSAGAVIDAFGGLARRDQILAAGLSGADITAAVRRGEVRRIRRAHYATPRASGDAAVAVRIGGRLGGVSAARSYGLWAGFDLRLHVVVPANAARLRAIRTPEGVQPDVGERQSVVHWADVEPARECWRPTLHDTLRQVAAWADQETAMATLDTALDLGLVSPAQLADALLDEPAASRVRAASAEAGSGSGYESIVVRRLRRRGLRVVQQVTVPGVGRIDAEIEGLLFLEIDGDEFHRTSAAYETDRRRDGALTARGLPFIRLTTRRIREDWPGCLADIFAALEHAHRLPFSGVFGGRGVESSAQATPNYSFTTVS
jgi:very-short-patch-repair endonuclease